MSIKDRINQRKAEIFTEINGNIRVASFNLLGKIQVKTPVDTGETRRAWTISKEADDHFVISNPLPHTLVLEYGLYPNPPKEGKGLTEGGYRSNKNGYFIS